MGQGISNQQANTYSHTHNIPLKPSPQIQHQSFLKLRKTPFFNSIRIIDTPSLFLQNITTTLTKLVSQRMGGNKLFTEQDILRLIETCLYGLAHLQSNGQAYRDLNMDNIYYDTEDGVFKLLPSELIYETSYSIVMRGKKFRYLAPEMIIALRMDEQDLQDEIMSRSNVFILGMILLQVCTLKSSGDCYDDQNFDIFDKMIQQRLNLVRELYPLKLAELLTSMLEYDYMKRLSVEELSILVNEEVATERNKQEEIKGLRKQMVGIKEDKKVVKQTPVQTGSEKQLPLQAITNRVMPQHQVPNSPLNKQISTQLQRPPQSQKTQLHYTQQYQPPLSNYQPPILSQRSPKSFQYSQPIHMRQSDKTMTQSSLIKPSNMSILSSKHERGERKKNMSPRRQTMGGSKYPSIIYQTDFETKENKDDSTDFSLLRIKEEIQKSRKRIQEFNRISPMELIEQE